MRGFESEHPNVQHLYVFPDPRVLKTPVLPLKSLRDRFAFAPDLLPLIVMNLGCCGVIGLVSEAGEAGTSGLASG